MSKNTSIKKELLDYLNPVIQGLEAGLSALSELTGLMDQVWGDDSPDLKFENHYMVVSTQILRDAEDTSHSCEQYLSKMDYIEDKVTESAQEIEEIINATDILTASNIRNNTLIKRLEKLSSQIEDMGQAVIDVSKQTKLLSYNVAIEASRTNREKNEFAVVAQEIRNLAEISASFAKNITKLIKKLHKHLHKVIRGTQTSGKTVKNELNKIKKVILTFDSIHDNTKSLFQGGKKIRDVSRDILVGARDVTATAEWMLSNENQIKIKKTQLLEAVNKQIQEYSDTILFGSFIQMNIEETGEQEIRDNINHFIAQYEHIKDLSLEIDRIINDIHYHFYILTQASNHFTNKIEMSAKNISEINHIAKKDQDNFYTLQETLQTDFEEITNISKYIQAIINKSSENFKDSHSLNTGSWAINNVVNELINHTTMTKMLAFNAALEASREKDSEIDYNSVVNDMKKLSNQSGQAAVKIKQIMNQVDCLISEIFVGMNGTIHSSNTIIEKVKRVINNIVLIRKNIDSTINNIMDICIFSGTIWKNISDVKKYIDESNLKKKKLTNDTTPLKDVAAEIRTTLQETTKPVDNLYKINKTLTSNLESK